MSLQRLNQPFEELDRFRRELNRFFDEEMSGRARSKSRAFSPQAELRERNGEFELDFDVPGMKKDDLKVELDEKNRTLTVRGERREEREEEEENVRFRERRFGSFERSFTLPQNVDPKKVSANYEDGVLKVHIPKTTKQAQDRKRIAIQ